MPHCQRYASSGEVLGFDHHVRDRSSRNASAADTMRRNDAGLRLRLDDMNILCERSLPRPCARETNACRYSRTLVRMRPESRMRTHFFAKISIDIAGVRVLIALYSSLTTLLWPWLAGISRLIHCQDNRACLPGRRLYDNINRDLSNLIIWDWIYESHWSKQPLT